MNRPLAVHWAVLERHFQTHATMVHHRFRDAGRNAVIRMWLSQTNEDGERLSHFEREAHIERHCELFRTWPAPTRLRVRNVKAHTTADLELVNLGIVESNRRVADQRPRGRQ